LQVGQLKHSLTALSTAVRTTALPEVRAVIDSVVPDLDSVKDYQTDVIAWLKPVVDLTGYHVYPMSGVTQGLDWWYNRTTDGVQMLPGDYQWVEPRLGDNTWQYASVPSAIDGNFRDVSQLDQLALDLAYVGSTKIQHIKHDADVAFFSLSKSFGLRNIRTGWYFSRKPDRKLQDLIYGAKYYNYFAAEIAERVIQQFDIDYIHSKLAPQQTEICQILDFTPSDSVWLATTTSDEFQRWRRQGTMARICLTGLYDYEKTQSPHIPQL